AWVPVSNLGLGLALSGATANLIVYLVEEYNVKSIDAAQIGNIVGGSTSLAPVIGAIVSDAFFGCYPLIVSSSIISLLAVVLLTLTAAVRPVAAATAMRIRLRRLRGAVGGSEGVSFHSGGAAGLRGRRVAVQLSRHGRRSVRQGSGPGHFLQLVLHRPLRFGRGRIHRPRLRGGQRQLDSGLRTVHRRQRRRPGRPPPAAQGSPFTGMARVVVAAFKKWNVKVSQQNPSYYYGSGGDDNPNSDAPTQSLR
ncbi:hypothetical protein GW17_00001164, partial [Ensete ventricosum]